MSGPLRIALLAFRGNPRSGGQGVYVTRLATALTHLGHHVEVVAGPPYPELQPDVPLVPLPSLELYREEDPFRPVRPPRGPIDHLELVHMRTGGYPEPLAFTLRALRWLRRHPGRFDVVHDNQSLGYGLLGLLRLGLPVVSTVHHPITVDLRLELTKIRNPARRLAVRRWYGFWRMQRRVARRLPRLITVSEAAAADLAAAFDVPRSRIAVVPNGVDTTVFRPLPRAPRPAETIVVTTSADSALKGLPVLCEALAKVRTERPVELVVVGKPGPRHGPTRSTIDRLNLGEAVRFTGPLPQNRLVDLYASADVAVVPSLYEGFSLPAVEAMACAVPLVATTGGALPEVAGADGETALLVPPGDPGALAGALLRVLGDRDLRRRLATAGRERVLSRFTWERTAAATADVYRALL